jgi:hypothetical protein
MIIGGSAIGYGPGIGDSYTVTSVSHLINTLLSSENIEDFVVRMATSKKYDVSYDFDLANMLHNTITLQMDINTQKTCTEAYTPDIIIFGEVTGDYWMYIITLNQNEEKTYESDMLNRDTHISAYTESIINKSLHDKEYLLDSIINKSLNATLYANELSLKTVNNFTTFSTSFLRPISEYSMYCQMIYDQRARIPTDSVINTLYWSIATALDQSYANVVSATHAMNISRADTTDLDTIGSVYHLKRYINESDYDYRNRLITQTSVLIGHGTKASCEAVVDQVNGIAGCDIKNGLPGIIRIDFDNDDARHAASDNRDTLENIIPNMIAAGIVWDLYISLIDYDTSLYLLGSDECPFNVLLYSRLKRDKSFYANVINVSHRRKWITIMSFISKKDIDVSKNFSIISTKGLNTTYSLKCMLKDVIDFEYEQSLLVRNRNVIFSYYADILNNKTVSKTLTISSVVSDSKTRRYNMSLTVV